MADYTPSGIEIPVTSGSTYQAFPSVVQVGSVSVAVWRDGPQHLQDPSDTFRLSRSTDGGVSWSPSFVFANASTGGGIVAMPDGELIAIIAGQVWRSADLGDTWTQGATVTYSGTTPFPTHLSWHADGSPDGLLLATAYDTTPADMPAVVSTSADRGVTWAPRATIATIAGADVTEPTLCALPDGSILAMLRVDNGTTPGIWQAKSTDLGRTWSAPTLAIANGTGLPVAISYQGVLALMYRVGAQWSWAWAVSFDNGATWIPRGDFTPGGARMLYGGWAPLPSGDLLAVYGREFSTTDCDIFAQRFTLVLPAVAEAVAAPQPRTTVTWLGCDLVSGVKIAELPDVTGTISRVLGGYTSSGLSLPIPLGGHGAVPLELVEAATNPGRTMLVAVVNDEPAWAGIVLTRQGGTDGTLRLGCATLEAYLGRRYVGAHTWVQQDQSTVIAAGLAGDAATEGIGLVVDATPSGVKRDRTYLDQDDATVLSRLTELMDVQGGPEWTIDLAWADQSQTAVAKILRIRRHIGVASSTPQAVFSSRGDASARYSYSEDYSDGRGANHIVATSAGEGEVRPQSVPARDVALLASGFPRYEKRYSPSSSITSPAVLLAHAAADLVRRRLGSRVFEITARWDADPRLNLTWALGDDIGWELTGHRHPNGIRGSGRCIGWELDMQAGTVRPILLNPEGE